MNHVHRYHILTEYDLLRIITWILLLYSKARQLITVLASLIKRQALGLAVKVFYYKYPDAPADVIQGLVVNT